MDNAKAVRRQQAIIELSAPFLGKNAFDKFGTGPKTECQRRVNDFRPRISDYKGAMRLLWSIIELLAAFVGKTAYDTIVTMSRNEHQHSISDFWSCILDNLMAIERR